MTKNIYKIFISSTWVPAFPPHLVVVLLFLPQTSLFPISLPSYVILSKVGKKERGSRRMEIHWYKTGVLVEKMATIEEEEIPISWFSWVEIPSSGLAFMQDSPKQKHKIGGWWMSQPCTLTFLQLVQLLINLKFLVQKESFVFAPWGCLWQIR